MNARSTIGLAWMVLCAGVLLSAAATVSAQQPAPPPADEHSQHQHEQAAPAGNAGSGPLNLPSGREGSGTAWLPDATPMYAVHGRERGWELMLHGNVFAQFLADAGDRGHDQFGSINWVMGMARRPVGRGRLGINAMFSLEPATIRGCGYPDLLATGELCDGAGIVDQQHPHDLLMEIAGSYEHPITDRVALQLYGGPAGEPALGPVGFPHRISAMPNPLAPISHHWLDATHITFGVVTAGVYGRKWKAETSIFNGREPDEDRLGFDLAALDSVSGRFWFLPTERLALQVSAGRLAEAEPDHDGTGRTDVQRWTASATYHRLAGAEGIWASTVAWGRNREEGESSDFVMAETSFMLDDQDTWFGRVDVGRKLAHDLDVHGPDAAFTVTKLQGGYARHVPVGSALKAGVGASVSVSVVPAGLGQVYGGRATPGVGLFVVLRPRSMVTGVDPHAGHRMP